MVAEDLERTIEARLSVELFLTDAPAGPWSVPPGGETPKGVPLVSCWVRFAGARSACRLFHAMRTHPEEDAPPVHRNWFRKSRGWQANFRCPRRRRSVDAKAPECSGRTN